MFQAHLLKKIVNSLLKPVDFQGGDFLEGMFDAGVRVGLDIGTSSIKIIEVEGTSQGPVVKTVAYQEFQRSFEAKGAMPQESLITQGLVELWRNYKIKSQDVRLVISDPAVYLRYLTIPRIEARELQKALRWQIEKYVPFAVEDASVDYQIVEQESIKDKTQMGIIAVAVERKVIDKYLGILKSVKVLPASIDISPFAVAKAVMKMTAAVSAETILVVDIGAYSMSMAVIKGRTLLMVRTIENAGDQMTRLIMESCAIDGAAAENMKRQTGIFIDTKPVLADDKFQRVLSEICAQWAQEMERSLVYCEREGLVEGVHKIVLCGGGAKLKGIDQFISRQLGLPVELIDIGRHISHKELSDGSSGSQFLAAYGAIF